MLGGVVLDPHQGPVFARFPQVEQGNNLEVRTRSSSRTEPTGQPGLLTHWPQAVAERGFVQRKPQQTRASHAWHGMARRELLKVRDDAVTGAAKREEPAMKQSLHELVNAERAPGASRPGGSHLADAFDRTGVASAPRLQSAHSVSGRTLGSIVKHSSTQ